MADELSNATSGESSTPTNDVGAAGAGGNDGQQHFTPDSTATNDGQPQQENFSAGWDLDDEVAEVAQSEDLTDEQIQEYLTDSRLDPSKGDLPKLVEDLRGSRANETKLKGRITQLEQQLAQFDQFGGVEGVNQMVSIGIRDLMANPQEGGLKFLSTIADQSVPAYWSMIDALAEHAPNDLLQRLQHFGHAPQEPEQRARLDAETLQAIPEQFRELIKTLPEEVVEDLLQQTEGVRNYNLQREADYRNLTAGQEKQARQAWDQQVKQAETAGQELINTLSQQFEKAHFAQLNKWQPLGPEAKEHNQLLYSIVVEGAFAQMMKDQQYAQMYQDCLGRLKNAPMKRLHNEGYAADADEREGRALAARFNTRLGQVMKDLIKNPEYGLDNVFRDARQWREHQRQQVPNRREIPGAGMSTSNGTGQKQGSALNENGMLSDDFMAGLKNKLNRMRG